RSDPMLAQCRRCALVFSGAAALLCMELTFAGQEKTPKPRYFMAVFAQETTPRAPRTAHTFATFVKLEGKSFEAHTISWLPKSDDIRLLRRFPEPGVNLDLKASVKKAADMRAEVHEWGPFEIK